MGNNGKLVHFNLNHKYNEYSTYTITILLLLSVKVGSKVYIGDDVIIKPNSQIFANVLKPSMIKENVLIAAGAILGKEIMIGANAKIDAGAVVQPGANVPNGHHVLAGKIHYF